MKNFIPYMITLAMMVICINYFNLSNQVKNSSTENEQIISNSIEAFLDTTSDKGAITAKDYNSLMMNLMGTGGTYEVNISITRLHAIPDPTQTGNYIYDYLPAYGWRSSNGGISEDYLDPKWAGTGTAPKGVQYLVKSDNVSILVKQVDLMPYQRTMISRMSTNTKLGEWSRSKAVRSTGSLITGNQADPFN